MRGAVGVERLRWGAGGATPGTRQAAEETAVALVHDAATTAVMMATPADLEDLGLGFTLSEGIVASPGELRGLEVVTGELGIEVRMWLRADASARLSARRRRIAGPTGCGLCGVDSLAEAVRAPVRVDAPLEVAPADLLHALKALEEAQALGRETRAVHAAALWRPGEPLHVREDVGRHNALDKLIGALARAERSAADGVLLLTSRVSVEMVQKAAVLGAPVVCAVSAPTALAVRTAEAAGLTLVGVARRDGFEVFTHPGRLGLG